MLHLKGPAVAAAATVATLGLAASAPAQDRGTQVFNFGGCVSFGQPDAFPVANEGFRPMTLVFNRNGVIVNQPPGVSFGGPAEAENQCAMPPGP